jgi:hypothetical protein
LEIFLGQTTTPLALYWAATPLFTHYHPKTPNA